MNQITALQQSTLTVSQVWYCSWGLKETELGPGWCSQLLTEAWGEWSECKESPKDRRMEQAYWKWNETHPEIKVKRGYPAEVLLTLL